MFESVSWIGIPEEEYKSKNIEKSDVNGRFVYFRHSFTLGSPSKCVVNISANTRYRMWVNERPVLSGPCRGDKWYTYYDTVDISGILHEGNNTMCVQVLLTNENQVMDGTDDRAALYSVVSHFPEHLLVIDSQVTDAKGNILYTLSTGKAEWKVCLDNSFYLTKYNNKNEFLGAMTESIDCDRTDLDWKKDTFDDSNWSKAITRVKAAPDKVRGLVGLMDKLYLYPRPIPLIKEEEPEALSVISEYSKEAGQISVVASEYTEEYTISPNAKVQLLFTSKVLTNGYFRFHFEGGRHSKVKLNYFEKFYSDKRHVKRDDYINGEMFGEPQEDFLILNGDKVTYEPFWYRTLRFLRMDIETGEETLKLKAPVIIKMGYPLEPQYKLNAKETWMNDLWDICIRTLENCMTDAYMDCPFWEQMQYPMDTRLQALFTYACDGNTELIKKALWEFHCSKIPAGLIQGKAPSAFVQVISTFSLHYIFMIREYASETGDIDEIRKYLGDVDDILTYYDMHRERKYGLVGDIGYWPFVDWQAAWAGHGGVPNALDHGPSTIINLMYAYGLEQAALIMELVGRDKMSEEYRLRKDEIISRVQELCFNNERNLFREGPGFEEYSQHAQSWAVLLDMCDKDTSAKVMRASFESDVIPCSFSTSYELFRACEKAGVYELTFDSLKRWADLLDEHCTTCPETPDYDTRSECHAWSALPIYELRHCKEFIEKKFHEIRPDPGQDHDRLHFNGRSISSDAHVLQSSQWLSLA